MKVPRYLLITTALIFPGPALKLKSVLYYAYWYTSTGIDSIYR